MAVEEMPYAWRETALTFLQLEGEAQQVRSARTGDGADEPPDGGAVVHESFESIRERRLREREIATND
jgi:hypothetical protein